jgi:excisionase family DNA binding protein
LVASELEARWNVNLRRVQQVETKLEQARQLPVAPSIEREELLRLAEDLPAVWDSPAADPALKQRITRILIQEVVVDVDEQTREIVLVIHWVGGRHSELRVPKPKTGQHGHCTKAEAVDIVRQMAADYPDEEIALTLNRLGLKTGVGNTWNEVRIRSLRSHLGLPACKPTERNRAWLNLQQAAKRLSVSATVVRRLIAHKVISATQIVPGAPWQIAAEDVDSPRVIQSAVALKNREGTRLRHLDDERTLPLPGFQNEE